MSTRETFFNPFKNWPFATSPAKVGLINSSSESCDCTVIGGKHFNSDGYECVAGFTLPYPLTPILGSSPSRFPPKPTASETIRLESSETGTNERKTAIDSLKAVKLQKFLKQLKQPVNDSSEAETSKNSSTENQKAAPINEEVNKSSKAVDKEASEQNQFTNGQSINRSVSNSTLTSLRDTNGTWSKSNGTQSASQRTFNSIVPTIKKLKDKEKFVWKDGPQETVQNYKVSYNSSDSREKVHRKTFVSENPPDRQNPEHLSATVNFTKIILGCSQCLFEPKLRVVPCSCLVCIECGGRFNAAVNHGSVVYCGCGERVVSILNLQDASGGAAPVRGPYPNINQWSPVTFTPSVSTTGASQFSPWKIEQTVPSPEQFMSAAAQVTGNTLPSMGFPASSADMSRMLMMDAETAIQNAPFIELGRNALAQNWACVKIGNIPYNVTSEELLGFLGGNANIVPEIAGSVGVHVIMDRSTGKTMDAYAEFMTAKDAWKCVSRRRSRVLGNRHLTLEVVNSSDLMKDIFPRAKGIFWDGVIPRLREDESELGTKTEIISREELVLIVNHARTPHRSPFSRKCLQRPFQSLMSIVSKFPWFAVDLYTIQQRDFIFHALISAIDILKRQIKRGRTMPNLDVNLLKCLLRVGIRCSSFTDAQKYELVKTAEFGAEGIQVDTDIGVLSGFEGLGKAVGAERKALEFYALLLELSVSPFLSEPSNQGIAAAELIRAKNITKQHPEDTKKSHLTMAETAALEWTTIEKAVRTVLPGKLPYVKSMKTNTGVWRERQN